MCDSCIEEKKARESGRERESEKERKGEREKGRKGMRERERGREGERERGSTIGKAVQSVTFITSRF